MDIGNRIIRASFQAIVAEAQRRNFQPPYEVVIVDGAGVELLVLGDEVQHSFPFTFKLASADNHTLEMTIEETEPTKPPRYLQ